MEASRRNARQTQLILNEIAKKEEVIPKQRTTRRPKKKKRNLNPLQRRWRTPRPPPVCASGPTKWKVPKMLEAKK